MTAPLERFVIDHQGELAAVLGDEPEAPGLLLCDGSCLPGGARLTGPIVRSATPAELVEMLPRNLTKRGRRQCVEVLTSKRPGHVVVLALHEQHGAFVCRLVLSELATLRAMSAAAERSPALA